jgi:hypothetical protein
VKSNTALFVEFLFFDVAALAFGVWQWWSVRPPSKDEPADPPASGKRPGHPEG